MNAKMFICHYEYFYLSNHVEIDLLKFFNIEFQFQNRFNVIDQAYRIKFQRKSFISKFMLMFIRSRLIAHRKSRCITKLNCRNDLHNVLIYSYKQIFDSNRLQWNWFKSRSFWRHSIVWFSISTFDRTNHLKLTSQRRFSVIFNIKLIQTKFEYSRKTHSNRLIWKHQSFFTFHRASSTLFQKITTIEFESKTLQRMSSIDNINCKYRYRQNSQLSHLVI